MSTVIMKRGTNVEMLNTPRIDGLIFFNTDDNCIYLDDGINANRTIFGGRIPMLTNVTTTAEDGASNNNVYTALAVKNGFCVKANVADSAENINNTNTNGRPVGCVGFKSIIGTDNISSVGSNVKNAISNIGDRLVVDNNKFVFDYQNGKWGFNTSEERGADTFHPFNSTALKLNSNTSVQVTNVQLNINSTTDAATTKLPIDFTTGTHAVTVMSGNTTISSNKAIIGGIIHVFADWNHGGRSGSHAHYMLVDGAWRAAPSTTPIASNVNATLGLPFSIPHIIRFTPNPYEDIKYYRADDLYYYVCTDNMIKIYKYEYTNYYDKGSWTELSNQRLILTNNTDVTDYVVGAYNQYAVYHGELHIFGGSYNDDLGYHHDTNHYIWSPKTMSWRVESNADRPWSQHTIYGTVVHNDQICIFYKDINEYSYDAFFGCDMYHEGGAWDNKSYYSLADTHVDDQSQWVEYNGEIHILGGSTQTNMHISLQDETIHSYANLKYPFRASVACVAPPIKITNSNTSTTINMTTGYNSYEEALYMDIPNYIHYMGTAQANPSNGNYRKNHYQMQDTYVGSIYNALNGMFIISDR